MDTFQNLNGFVFERTIYMFRLINELALLATAVLFGIWTWGYFLIYGTQYWYISIGIWNHGGLERASFCLLLGSILFLCMCAERMKRRSIFFSNSFSSNCKEKETVVGKTILCLSSIVLFSCYIFRFCNTFKCFLYSQWQARLTLQMIKIYIRGSIAIQNRF